MVGTPLGFKFKKATAQQMERNTAKRATMMIGTHNLSVKSSTCSKTQRVDINSTGDAQYKGVMHQT